MIYVLWSYIWRWWIRPLFKWILRQLTKLHELQRVCYGDERGARRTLGVESSLNWSRSDLIQKLLEQLNKMAADGKITTHTFPELMECIVFTVVKVKDIKPEIHQQFSISFRDCVSQIYSYKNLVHLIEKHRTIGYDADNEDHESKLLQLWSLMMPDEKLDSRITTQWKHIGFQGDDPKTDFRGMGILGLDNLLYFAAEYTGAARHVLAHSHHPVYGYSYAIVGINLTFMTFTLLRQGHLKTHFYNLSHGLLNIVHFHRVYCYMFYEFDKFWLEQKPSDIMEFNRIRDLFEEEMIKKLSDPSTILKIKLSVETL